MKTILSYEFPPMTSYTGVAYPLSIMWSHKEEILPWFCEHFIQLIITDGNVNYGASGNFYDNIGGGRNQAYINYPHLRFYKGHREIFVSSGNEFTKNIENFINKGYFIDVCLNHYYLSCSDHYNKNQLMHSAMIYGYDNEKRLIYVMGFFNSGKYIEANVTYDELNDSYFKCSVSSSDPAWFEEIMLLRHLSYDYKFNIELMIKSLNDYLMSVDSFSKFKYDYYIGKNEHKFGLEYYDILHENIMQRSFVDIRLLHILYDHKAAMKIRLDFLTANHYIKEKNKDKLFATFNELYVSTTKVRNLAVKYQITSDDSILQRISAYCKELKQLDSSFTSYLLESLTMS